MAGWLRLYIGTCEDAKFRIVSRNACVTVPVVIAIWVSLLEDAGSPDHRGLAIRGADLHAIVLGLDAADFERTVEAFVTLGMASRTSEGIAITAWAKRQFEGDVRDPTNAVRQRRFRNKQRQSGDGVTRNASQTGDNTSVTPRSDQNRTDSARGRAREEARRTWNDDTARWRREIGEDRFERDFGTCRWSAPPTTLEWNLNTERAKARGGYGQKLEEVFGHEVRLVVSGEVAA